MQVFFFYTDQFVHELTHVGLLLKNLAFLTVIGINKMEHSHKLISGATVFYY